MKYYAVRVGRKVVIYYNWADCKAQVDGYPKAAFKSFTDITSANNFIGGAANTKKVTSKPTPQKIIKPTYLNKQIFVPKGFLKGDDTNTYQKRTDLSFDFIYWCIKGK